MYDDVVNGTSAALDPVFYGVRERGKLDELGAGADDAEELHCVRFTGALMISAIHI